MKRKKKIVIEFSNLLEAISRFSSNTVESLTDGSKITKLADDLVRAMFDFVRWLFGTLNSK